MNFSFKHYFCTIFFSLVLIFSMNMRGFAAYTDYVIKIENKNSTEKLDSNKNFSSSNSSEENENQGSNTYEVLEKLNHQINYCFKVQEESKKSVEHNFFHLDLFSLLKPSLNTPPPELV